MVARDKDWFMLEIHPTGFAEDPFSMDRISEPPDTETLLEDLLIFADEEPENEQVKAEPWKLLVVDDDPAVHQVTKLALSDIHFESRAILFLHAYSDSEARMRMAEHPDTAVILLDVVMESEDSGLKFVAYLRETVKNKNTRIILRTGQPGQAPESSVILEYDINDYKTKAELTSQKLFTAMIVALRAYRDITLIEHQKSRLEKLVAAYSRFVPREFLHFLKKECITEVRLGDQVEREMTVLFSDIRGFTNLSEIMTPSENFRFINSYLSRMEPLIRECGGFIDKFIGDAIMALFPHKPDDAVKTAIEMLRTLPDYNAGRVRAGYRSIRIGVGLHTGQLMLGTIGGQHRMDGTVISDAVNLASRVESLTKEYGVNLLLTGQTMAKLEEPSNYSFREIDHVAVKGKMESVTVYEVLDGEPQEQQKLREQSLPHFQDAILHFRAQRYHHALRLFERVYDLNDQDLVAKTYIDRCRQRVNAIQLISEA